MTFICWSTFNLIPNKTFIFCKLTPYPIPSHWVDSYERWLSVQICTFPWIPAKTFLFCSFLELTPIQTPIGVGLANMTPVYIWTCHKIPSKMFLNLTPAHPNRWQRAGKCFSASLDISICFNQKNFLQISPHSHLRGVACNPCGIPSLQQLFTIPKQQLPVVGQPSFKFLKPFSWGFFQKNNQVFHSIFFFAKPSVFTDFLLKTLVLSHGFS